MKPLFSSKALRKTLTLVLLAFSCLVFAQNTNEKLAAQFYNNGEYEQAVNLYKKVYKRNKSVYVYENYLNCLVALEEEKNALKLVEKQIGTYNGSIKYLVDYGYVLDLFGKKEKAKNYYQGLIEDNSYDRNKSITLAQTFLRRQLKDEAESTYLLAVKKVGLLGIYNNFLNFYRLTNNKTELANWSLKVLLADPATLNNIKRQLDIVFKDEESAENLRVQTLLYIQKHPNKQVFNELLLEIYLRQKKYSSALRQSIAMDKRNKENGSRVLSLGNICLNNKQFEVAIKSFEYVLSLGENQPNYAIAEQSLLNGLYAKTTNSYAAKNEDVTSLINKINQYLKKNGKNYNTSATMLKLAELYVFYSPDLQRGIDILERLIVIPRQRANQLAEAKLLLGDAHLINNNIWEAKLLYGQVDKTFKEDALGQEAKYRSAKLSYYTGDFEWAKGQLDILKTATTQLISNNAIQLSLLIQDNTGLDSTEAAMKEYATAEFLLFQNKMEECKNTLNLLPFKYPNHTLADEVLFLKAKVEEKQKNYILANELYEKVYSKYSDDILADNALFNSGKIYLLALNDPTKAKELFEKILLKYGSGLYSAEARKIYFGLEEGKTKEELFFNGIIN